MTPAIVWILLFFLPDGHGGWDKGHYPPGSLLGGSIGHSFDPAPGWTCNYNEGKRTDGGVYRFVYCANRKTHTGAVLEVDACGQSTPEQHARMSLLDGAASDPSGEAAMINLACIFDQPNKKP